MRVQRSEFKGEEVLFLAEDRGSIDRTVNRSWMKRAKWSCGWLFVRPHRWSQRKQKHRPVGRSTDWDCQELLEKSIGRPGWLLKDPVDQKTWLTVS